MVYCSLGVISGDLCPRNGHHKSPKQHPRNLRKYNLYRKGKLPPMETDNDNIINVDLNDVEETSSDAADRLQEDMTTLTTVEFGKKCSEQERRYCEQRVFHMKNKKDSMIGAGSKAKDEYLSKLAWETEQRPHVQEYMKELMKVRSVESTVAIQELIYKTRRAIDSVLLGKTPEKAEPLLRLMAEITGYLKSPGGPSTTTTKNTLIIGGDTASKEASSLENDILRFKQLTGVVPPS